MVHNFMSHLPPSPPPDNSHDMAQDKIGGYSERELLILLNHSVEQLKAQFTQHAEKMMEMQLMVRELDTRMKIWATVIGFISGIAGALAVKFLTN